MAFVENETLDRCRSESLIFVICSCSYEIETWVEIQLAY